MNRPVLLTIHNKLLKYSTKNTLHITLLQNQFLIWKTRMTTQAQREQVFLSPQYITIHTVSTLFMQRT